MTIEREDPEKFPRLVQPDETEALYNSVGGPVGRMLVREHGMSEAVVEGVLRDVFAEYVKAKALVADPVAWITHEILARAATLMRLRGAEVESDTTPYAQYMLGLIRTQPALATLPKRAREALVLMFLEQKTYAQIAEELSISVGYAERLVAKGLKQLGAWKPYRGTQE